MRYHCCSCSTLKKSQRKGRFHSFLLLFSILASLIFLDCLTLQKSMHFFYPFYESQCKKPKFQIIQCSINLIPKNLSLYQERHCFYIHLSHITFILSALLIKHYIFLDMVCVCVCVFFVLPLLEYKFYMGAIFKGCIFGT
jgi:membrane-bound metal-dependent hydrolase YbcI (DUF457 family)